MLRLFRLLMPVVLTFSLVAASTAANHPHAAVAGPVSDAQIDATIRAKLSKSKIGKDGFHYKVARGVVTWEGNTAVPQHKGAATRMAHSSGASQVVNNIQVTGGNKPGTPLKKAYVQE